MSGVYATRDQALLVIGVKTGVRMSEWLSWRVSDGWPHDRGAERVAVSPWSLKGTTEGRRAIVHAKGRAALVIWAHEDAVGHRSPEPGEPGGFSPHRCVQY